MDVNTSYNYLISSLEELLDLYASYKIKVIKPTKKKFVPWKTKALIKSSKKCIPNQLIVQSLKINI